MWRREGAGHKSSNRRTLKGSGGFFNDVGRPQSSGVTLISPLRTSFVDQSTEECPCKLTSLGILGGSLVEHDA